MNKRTFVAFTPIESGFRSTVSMTDFASDGRDNLEPLLSTASGIYRSSISALRSSIANLNKKRPTRERIKAREVWNVGDAIFALVAELAGHSLEIDGLYDHLERDVPAKRKWLEKVVILRRYVADIDRIPPDLNWGAIEKGTRRAAEKLASS